MAYINTDAITVLLLLYNMSCEFYVRKGAQRTNVY